MNKRLLSYLLLFVLLCGCAGNSSSSSKSNSASSSHDTAIIDTIKERGYLIAGCKMDVPGLGLYDEDTKTWSGLEIELAYSIAASIFETDVVEAKEKERVHFVGVTVKDREEKLEKQDIDCMIATYTITDERAKKFALSDSYYTDYIGIMVRYKATDNNSLGSGNIKSIANLDGKKVGVARNSTTRKDMLEYINTMNTIKVTPIFFEYDGYPALFKALKAGNIDAMSVDVSILNGYVDKSTKILGDRFAGQHYGVAVNKGHEALIDIANSVIAGL